MVAELELPFKYSTKEEFASELANWIAHVFYDILPEHGYEIREEQIFTAFQLADAVCKKKIHLAEAGLGTGKTFAYLLTAIAYARFSKKPAIIACASTTLQEQLAGPKGDIAILSRLLNLKIDARMAKDPRHYICDVRINNFINGNTEKTNGSFKRLKSWYENTTRGERSEVPDISDRIWIQISWNEDMACDMCSQRGYCKQVKAREHYRQATDLVIVDHETFFNDLWTREERINDGKLPLLPKYLAVFFDEGHKIVLPAAMRAGRQIVQEDLENIALNLEKIQGARTSLISAAVALDGANLKFFEILQQVIIPDEVTERLPVRLDNKLKEAAQILYHALENQQFELQNEQELHIESLSLTKLDAYDLIIERTMAALKQLFQFKAKETIVWVDKKDETLWVVPRDLNGMLDKYLFSKQLPVVFSSATLSTGGDFSYFSRVLGLGKPSFSTVDSSFDFKKQAVVYLPEKIPDIKEKDWFLFAIEQLVFLLNSTKGRALILTNSPLEVKKIRAELKKYHFPFELIWEDQGERGYLVQKFRDEVSSVLVGSGFWEGIDVPGEALSLLVIWQLPFPAGDPLIEARRGEAQAEGTNPLIMVDYPEMSLKLKQGCGRLIRTTDDRGLIAILQPILGTPWEQFVLESLPPGANVVNTLDDETLKKYISL